jgi:leader peptidase (prepilin peptidase)/N-methyltransferase
LGPPWWATALVSGASCALLAAALGPVPELPLLLGLAVLGTALAAIDLACRRLPSTVVLPAFAIATAGLGVVAAISGSWGALGRALVGAIALGAVYLALYLLPGGGLGFGDVQLAALLGLFLGYLGLSYVLWAALLPWLLNAPVVLALLMLRRVDRRSRLPFGPALLGGALLAVVVPGLVAHALS